MDVIPLKQSVFAIDSFPAKTEGKSIVVLGIEDECIERDDVSFAQHDVVTILVHGRQLTASNLRPIVRLRRATRGSFLSAFLS